MRFEGAPIRVRFRPGLTAHRGRLLSESDSGQPVFAGSFLRRREIVLDSGLLDDPPERARILIHELFHFVWLRLGNRDRASWREVVEAEWRQRARGELGWSSEYRKRDLLQSGDRQGADRKWREYVCESFCDTSAWMYASVEGHAEFTLAQRWTAERRQWFQTRFEGPERTVRI